MERKGIHSPGNNLLIKLIQMKEFAMRVSLSYLTVLCAAILSLTGYSSQAAAQMQFFDDFDNRAKDQAIVGNNWTWYDQTFEGDTCTGTPSGFGPYDDGNPNDYEVEN